MVGAYGTYGEEVRHMHGFSGERDILGNLGLNGRIILKWVLKKLNQVVDWIDLVQLSLLWP